MFLQGIFEWFCSAKKSKIARTDQCLLAIMIMMLFLNTNGLDLDKKAKAEIEAIQTQYAHLLHKYLKSHKNEPSKVNSLFHQGLMIIHDSQEAYELSLKRLKLF